MRYGTIQKLNDEEFKRCTGYSAAPLNKCWQLWKQACVTLAGQPHSAERTSCWWLWCTGVSIELSFTLAWTMVSASRQSAARSKRLKMCWSNPSSFTCRARKHCSRVMRFLKLCWWMRPNSRLSAQKKTKTALQRQKEPAHPKNAVDCRLEHRTNPRYGLLFWKPAWLSVVQTKPLHRGETDLYFSRCRLSRIDQPALQQPDASQEK